MTYVLNQSFILSVIVSTFLIVNVSCQSLNIFNGSTAFSHKFLTSGTQFYTLPNNAQLPYVKSPGMQLTLTQATSTYIDTAANATYNCSYAVCVQPLVRSSLDPFSWPYGGCTNVGNQTNLFGDIINASGYNGMPTLNQSINIPVKPGPLHISVAVQTTAPSTVHSTSDGCVISFSINVPPHITCAVGLWGDLCQPLNGAITSPSTQSTLNVTGTTVNSTTPYLLGVNLDNTLLAGVTVLVTTATAYDNATVTGRTGTAPTSNITAFNASGVTMSGLTSLTTSIDITTPAYRSRFASALEQYSYIFAIQPNSTETSIALNNITVNQLLCPVALAEYSFGPSCAYGYAAANTFTLLYGSQQHLLLGTANFYNNLFIVVMDFQNTVGQTSFSFGLIPVGGYNMKMFIRKGGM